MGIDTNDVNFRNFLKKFTYSSDPSPGEKIVMSNGAFAQCLIWLKIERQLKRLVEK